MAILRARGGSSLTTRPPMSTSPSVGCSSPAMVRSSVVLPHPEGPRRTRYSPSSVARSTPSTARTRPLRAADAPAAPPLLEDRLDLRLGLGHRLLGVELPARRPGEHGGDHEGPEHLADGGV